MLGTGDWSRESSGPTRDGLVIGLVNNMSDRALHPTEHQFRGLLDAASHNRSTYLRYFSLPGLPRGPQAQAYVKRAYEDLSELWSGPLDGLIVTGTEPRASSLEKEPYWPALKDLINRVNDRAIPTIWSCLAAQAAVLEIHGIYRRRLRTKLSGVFQCRKVLDHEILGDGPACWSVPHSRWNELPEQELVSKGYRILSRSPEVGADIFVLEGKSLSIFLQGHFEYDSEALFREYRRDVRRFLAGEREDYPSMPRGYFDDASAVALVKFQERAMSERDPGVLAQFPETRGRLPWKWREPALRLYANWLSYIAKLHTWLPRTEPIRHS
jgi:homoserine O-succinyltransferase/O-acetyltransferase